jgi:hypothetical protein
MARRSYGSGSLAIRPDANGVETWHGWWRVGGRRVKAGARPQACTGVARGTDRAAARVCMRCAPPIARISLRLSPNEGASPGDPLRGSWTWSASGTKGRSAAPQSCLRAALRLGEDAPRRLPRPAHIPSVGIRCGRARRTSSPCTARGAPGDNGPLLVARRGATPVRPSSPFAPPAFWRLSRALVETSADLHQQLGALSVRLVGARGAGLLASHRDKPRLSGRVSEASRAATRCTATCSAAYGARSAIAASGWSK